MVRIDHFNVMVSDVREVGALLIEAGAKLVWDTDYPGCSCPGFSAGNINIALLDPRSKTFMPYTPYHGDLGLWTIQFDPEQSTDHLIKYLDSKAIPRGESVPILDVPVEHELPGAPEQIFSCIKVDLLDAPGCGANYIEYLKPFPSLGQVYSDTKLQFVEFQLGVENVESAVEYYKKVFDMDPSGDNVFTLGNTLFRIVKGTLPFIVLRANGVSSDVKEAISKSAPGIKFL